MLKFLPTSNIYDLVGKVLIIATNPSFSDSAAPGNDVGTINPANPTAISSLTDDPFDKPLCAPGANAWINLRTDKPLLLKSEIFDSIPEAIFQVAPPDKNLVMGHFDLTSDLSPRDGKIRISVTFYKGHART